MFDFLRLGRSQQAELSVAMRTALVAERLQAGVDPAKLTVVQRRGSYSGRSVNYFRVFDPAAAAAAGLQPRKYEDLDGHTELILGAGHVESGGAVVLTPLRSVHVSTTPARLQANRESHGDDERVVFPDGASSSSG